MRILIVDDDLTSRTILQKYLEPNGSCDIAVDGKEAIQAFETALDNNPYDLICMDIMMPYVDGMQAVQEIRTTERKKGIDKSEEVKIIMTTAMHDPKIIADAFHKSGATSYIVKPVTKEILYIKLRKFGLIK